MTEGCVLSRSIHHRAPGAGWGLRDRLGTLPRGDHGEPAGKDSWGPPVFNLTSYDGHTVPFQSWDWLKYRWSLSSFCFLKSTTADSKDHVLETQVEIVSSKRFKIVTGKFYPQSRHEKCSDQTVSSTTKSVETCSVHSIRCLLHNIWKHFLYTPEIQMTGAT